MRAALIHDERAGTALNAEVFATFRRCCPGADLYTATPSLASRRTPDGRPVRHLQLRPRNARPLLSDEYDVAVSTSLRAALRITVPIGMPHVCYVGPQSATERANALEWLGETRHSPGMQHPEIPVLAELKSYSSRDYLATRHSPLTTRHSPESIPHGITHCIAASPTVRNRILTRIGSPVSVIAPPIATQVFRPAREARAGHYLMVCDRAASTELAIVLEACRRLDRKIAVIGVRAIANAAFRGRGNACWFLGDSSAESRRDAYRRCRALIFAGVSDFEPAVVEAQACGTPVVALHRKGAADLIQDCECAGQGTGIFFDEPTPWSLASAMQEFERRPQKCDPALAVANAAQFSTARFEREIDAYLDRLLCSGNAVDRDIDQSAMGNAASPLADDRGQLRSAA